MASLSPAARYRLIAAVVLSCAILLAACAAPPRVPGIYQPENEVSERLGPSPLPAYREGDVFRFSGGRVERVAAVKGDDVYWQRESGRELVRHRSFLLPTLAWETGKRRGAQRLLDEPGDLWPLTIGKLGSFRVERSLTDKASGEARRSYRKFDCYVETAETVTVPAGSFDTYRISCRRFNTRGSRLYETLTWHYAPTVGHYVRRETENHRSGKRRVIELASYKKAGS